MSSLSSNNVIYGFLVAPNEPDEETGETGELVIDSNALARELILKQEKAYKQKLLDEERERRLEAMRESGTEIPEGMDPDEFLGLADTIMQDEEEETVDYGPAKEEILAEAHEEAQRIIDDANASYRINEYIVDKWYKLHKECAWYDSHKNNKNLYTGYWSFEAGAVAKILGIDDSSLKDVKYYPYDLVHYQK